MSYDTRKAGRRSHGKGRLLPGGYLRSHLESWNRETERGYKLLGSSMTQSICKPLLRQSTLLCNYLLHYVECLLADKSVRALQFPPVFIIGAPRSGSTLIYQAMLDYFNFGYLSNLHCMFFGAPSFVARFTHRSGETKPSDYSSEFGQTSGWAGPSECGPFWYRFFRRRPQYVPKEEMTIMAKRRLRGVIRSLAKAMSAPILFKNMPCALRLGGIAEALPEALFVVTKRDEVAMALSLLAARKERYGTYERWLSMEPPNFEALKQLPCHEQVIEQIRSIYELIDAERAKIGGSRFVDVAYESFCSDTYAILEALADFFAENGVSVQRRGEVPKTFECRGYSEVESKLRDKLVAYARGQ